MKLTLSDHILTPQNPPPVHIQDRCLLINPKDSYILGSPPLGIGYLMSYARKIGKNEVKIHDENFTDREFLNQKLERTIDEFQPTFVGVSFPSSTVFRTIEILKYFKTHHPDVVLFAGGYHPTSDPEATLRTIPELDFIILDQAEYSFAHIGKDWARLPSVAYINVQGEYIENPKGNPIAHLDDIPYIDRSWFDPRYFYPTMGTISGIYGKTATLMSSRGCPYRCSFCSIELLQKEVDYHGIDYVLGEIDSMLTTLGKVDYLYFLDVMFLTKWSRVENLCEELIKSRILKNIKWAATVAANVTTLDKVKLMKEAGCFYLAFGLESNSEHSLKLINKVAKPKDNQTAVDACRQLGVKANSAFLFGIPGETEHDLQETINFVKKNRLFSTGINFMKPLPGSPFYYDFLEKGWLKKDIQTWHDISSIHHKSENFNDAISQMVYDKYIKKFYKTVRFRARMDHYQTNLLKQIKYKLFPFLTPPAFASQIPQAPYRETFEAKDGSLKTSRGLLDHLKVDTVNFKQLSDEDYKRETVSNWSESPCGSNYSEREYLTKEYFDEIEKHRYFTHPWILDTINSLDLQGKKVLEIGCGMGTDHLAMARKGGIMHTVDLTPRNLEITRERFKQYGYRTQLALGDAEFLPYPTNSMDFVYSFGVIHHSPDTDKIISEIHRVLKPGGKCYVTVYHKHSLFFWWSVFFGNFLWKKGWKKRTLQQQISLIEYPNNHENMVIRLYRKNEFKGKFDQFKNTTSSINHLIPADIFCFSRFFKNPFKPSPFLNRLAHKLGWYITVKAMK